MKISISDALKVSVVAILAGWLCPAVHAQLPHWWVYAPKGTHVGGGPGAAAPPGALVVSPVETGLASNLSVLIESIGNLTDSLGDLSSKQEDERKIIQASIGPRAAGEDLGQIKPDVDPVSLARRRQMIEELKSRPDADKYQHFITYFETMQTHEARELLFIERANTLMKVHQRPLNWQERIRLAAEVGILNTQDTISRQEAVEAYNRAVVKASVDRLADTQAEFAHRQQKTSVQMMETRP